jgi:hypothetical protein
MTVDLTTTNVLLGVLATVSILEVLAVIVLVVAGFMMFRRLTELIGRIEERQVAPAAARVNAILDDVKAMTMSRSAPPNVRIVMAGWWRRFRRD